MKTFGFFGWWDDAVAVANRLAMEHNTRYRVEATRTPLGQRWTITEPRPRVEVCS